MPQVSYRVHLGQWDPAVLPIPRGLELLASCVYASGFYMLSSGVIPTTRPNPVTLTYPMTLVFYLLVPVANDKDPGSQGSVLRMK